MSHDKFIDKVGTRSSIINKNGVDKINDQVCLLQE